MKAALYKTFFLTVYLYALTSYLLGINGLSGDVMPEAATNNGVVALCYFVVYLGMVCWAGAMLVWFICFVGCVLLLPPVYLWLALSQDSRTISRRH